MVYTSDHLCYSTIMWKLCSFLFLALLGTACAGVPGQVADAPVQSEAKTDSKGPTLATENPAFWQAVWVKGFDPDWPTFAETPFDWTKNILTTDGADPGSWLNFHAGCNKLWRYPNPELGNDRGAKNWWFWPGLEGCTELVQGGNTEIIARSMLLERSLIDHIKDAPDYRRDYVIDDEGYLIWQDEAGKPLARFQSIPNPSTCERLKVRWKPMPIECAKGFE